MLRHLALYRHFVAQRFKALLEYRLNLLIGAVGTAVVQAAAVDAIFVVLGRVPSIAGFTLHEILLVYGLLLLSESITHMFADNLWTVGHVYVRAGDFDRFLVRPVNPLFHLLADRFCHDGIGNLVLGAILVARSSAALGLAWTAGKLAYLGLAVLSGGGIFIALNLITATSAFFLMDSVPVTKVVHNLHELARYPLGIYPRAVQRALTWVVPYGFASYYPACHLLGRDVGLLAWAAPAVAAVLLGVAYRVWLFGLRHYQGTGS